MLRPGYAPEKDDYFGFHGAALSGHTGMSHDGPGIIRYAKAQLMAWDGPLVNLKFPLTVIGDPGGVCSPDFAGRSQDGEDVVFLFCR